MHRCMTTLIACLYLIALSSGFAQAAQLAADESEGSESVEFRTWTDASGQFTIEAAMVGFADGKVELRRRDGSSLAVPADRLGKADRRYLAAEITRRKMAARRPEPKPEPEPEVPSATPATPSNSNWPGWRGPSRDGKSPDTGLLKSWPEGGPPLLWHARGIGKGYSTVAVVDGKVYTTGVIGERLVISIFDTEGNRVAQVPHDMAWTKNYPGGRSTPMIDDGNLYLISGHGLVGCYDLRSMQKPKWSVHMRDFGGTPPEWGYAESVLILGELAVITPGGAKCIVALKKSTGQFVWASSGFNAGAQYGSCYAFEFGGVPIIAAGTHGGLFGVDARNGRAVFANPFASGNTANCPTPVAADGYVFWAAGYGKGGVCLKLEGARDRVTVQEAWTTRDMVCQHGGYIVDDGHIYGNNEQGWSCVELASGETVWSERAVGKGSVCFADGMLYLFAEQGGRAGLATCSPSGLEMRGEFSVEGEGTSWAHPVVIGGRLYLRYDDNLYCFNVRAE